MTTAPTTHAWSGNGVHPTVAAVQTAIEQAVDAERPTRPERFFTELSRAAIKAVADQLEAVWGEWADEEVIEAAEKLRDWLREVAA